LKLVIMVGASRNSEPVGAILIVSAQPCNVR
jgi:hypothetical protein